MRVNAVAYFRIVDPKAAIVQVENYMVATSQIAQTTLRSVLGQHSLDELLSEREKINAILQGIIDEQTAPWGIKVSVVEVKDVEIPQGMQRAMARQAEAERERRAKVINAEGEFQASERLKDAAIVIEEHPIALQLRYLQTLLELGSSQSTTIVFPAPVDIISSFLPKRSSAGLSRREPAARLLGRGLVLLDGVALRARPRSGSSSLGLVFERLSAVEHSSLTGRRRHERRRRRRTRHPRRRRRRARARRPSRPRAAASRSPPGSSGPAA